MNMSDSAADQKLPTFPTSPAALLCCWLVRSQPREIFEEIKRGQLGEMNRNEKTFQCQVGGRREKSSTPAQSKFIQPNAEQRMCCVRGENI